MEEVGGGQRQLKGSHTSTQIVRTKNLNESVTVFSLTLWLLHVLFWIAEEYLELSTRMIANERYSGQTGKIVKRRRGVRLQWYSSPYQHKNVKRRNDIPSLLDINIRSIFY